MAVRLNPYISFRDNAREAIEFYHDIFGGELTISTFKEFNASSDSSEDDLVMHSMIETEDIDLMASDTPKRMEYNPGTNISVSLSGEAADEDRLKGYFEKLSDGGEVRMPLENAMWGDRFGMLTDKFGVQWMVNIAGE